MMKKPIKNTKYFATAEGFIEDSNGLRLPMIKKQGGNYFVKLPGIGRRSVPKLIVEAFLGNSTRRIIHIDGDRSNNSIYNLELVNH